PIGSQPKIAHQRDVLLIAMIMIAGDVAGIAVGDAPFLPAERVPYAGTPAVLVHGSFDLIARRGNAPHKAAICLMVGSVVLGHVSTQRCPGDRARCTAADWGTGSPATR